MSILGLSEELLKKAGMLDLAKKIEENSQKPFYEAKTISGDDETCFRSQVHPPKYGFIISLSNDITLFPDGVISCHHEGRSFNASFKDYNHIDYDFHFLAPAPLNMKDYLVLLAYAENSCYLHEIEFMTGYSVGDTINSLINQLNQDNYVELLPLLNNRIAMKQLEFLIEQDNPKKDLLEKIITTINKKTGNEVKLEYSDNLILL